MRGRRSLPGAATLLSALVLVLLLLTPGAALGTDEAPPPPAAGEPWFGPELDWSNDSAADYEDRLGETPSLYAQRVAYPLTEDSGAFLRQLAEQAASQGAVAVLGLEPSVALQALDSQDAEALAQRLRELHEELATTFLVRFAPEMNGTWYPWGQQPTAYVDAFGTVADAVHARAPSAQMVWSPVYGAGYPYGAAYGDVDPTREQDTEALDTDGSGLLDEGDDPYGPYWPGEAAVDWVGLTLYHFGRDLGRVDNELDLGTGGETGDLETSEGFELDTEASPGALRERLEERFNYAPGAGGTPFYERFPQRFDLPFLVQTGALWIPDGEGDPERAIKQDWWRQVLAVDEDYPLLRGITWLEDRRPEAEAGGRTVDWRATRTEQLAGALADDLDGQATLGPVTRVLDPEGADDVAVGVAPVVDPTSLAVAAWSLLVLLLLALLARRARPAWSWTAEPSSGGAAEARDERLDLLRGLLLVVLVAAHVEVLAGGAGPVARLMGATTGPEAFVLLSGVVAAMSHDRLVGRVGEISASARRWRRAAALWLACVGTALVVLGLSYVPGVDTASVTTWPPDVDGGVDLFAGAERLLEHPPPWEAVRELFVLGTGVWPLTLLGLLVVLGLVSPVALWLLRRRLWWVLLALSWGLYAWGVVGHPDWTAGRYEAAYPPLVWQVVFTHGLVLGYHRDALARVWRSPLARWAGIGVVAGLAVALTTVRLVAPGQSPVLAWWSGPDLPAGRLASLAVVALVATTVAHTCWSPLQASLGRVLVPLGRHGPTLLLAHVALLVLLASVVSGLGAG